MKDMPRLRCGALIKRPWKKTANGTTRLRQPTCQLRALANGRCRYHGGLTTGGGPKTDAGRARALAALVEGKRRYLARLKEQGRKAPGGRPRKSAAQKAERAAESESRRIAALPILEQRRLAALDVVARMKRNWEANR